MARRALYMYGAELHKDPNRQVDAGLGKGMSTGTIGLVQPTRTIREDTPDGTWDKVGPIHVIFQLTPNTEAPSEMNYLGWFDGNAAHLHNLPPSEVGARYVAAMEGADNVLRIARDAYNDAKTAEDYRWAAELLGHVVFSDPNNTAAKQLQADVLEQLGYQAESGPWRNFYLSAAQELRDRPVGLPKVPAKINAGVVSAMPVDMVFDYLGIRLDGPRVHGKDMNLGFTFRDPLKDDPADVTMLLRNSVLVYQPHAAKYHQATYDLTREAFDNIVVDRDNIAVEEKAGNLVATYGRTDLLKQLFYEYLVVFDQVFPITLP